MIKNEYEFPIRAGDKVMVCMREKIDLVFLTEGVVVCLSDNEKLVRVNAGKDYKLVWIPRAHVIDTVNHKE